MNEPDNDHTLPLIEETVLQRLRAELPDRGGIWEIFIGNYTQLLPRRIERIRDALTTADPDAAMDAALSLRTSSQMIGAARLADLVHRLEHDLRDNDRDPATFLPELAATYLKKIHQSAEQTRHHLDRYLHP